MSEAGCCSFPAAGAAVSSCVYRRNLTYGSCYRSSHVQSELVTDHLHFTGTTCSQRSSVPGLAKPSRASFEVDCRHGLGATRVATGTPALVLEKNCPNLKATF